MADPQPGSQVAKDLNIALARIYNYVKNGSVKNHKKNGFPLGKGIEVDPDEVRAAMEASAAKRGNKAPRQPRQSKAKTQADNEAMHEALDEEEREKRARKRASGEDGNTVRLKRREVGQRHPACPIFPSHGMVAPVEVSKGKPPRFHCWNQEHDGRPRTHSGGFAPATQSSFTEEELHIEQPAGRLGVIMLEWINAGRTDLAESLETWTTKNKIPVWIPVPLKRG